MRIGFAIIGTGVIAHVHARALLKNKNCKLIAVRSENKERAEEFAKKYEIKAYIDYEELLKDKDIQAVDIVTKNNKHAELGIKAANAKKHVLVLSKENMEKAMKHEPLSLPKVKEGMYFAKYLDFPIGLLKVGSQRTELLVPKMA